MRRAACKELFHEPSFLPAGTKEYLGGKKRRPSSWDKKIISWAISPGVLRKESTVEKGINPPEEESLSGEGEYFLRKENIYVGNQRGPQGTSEKKEHHHVEGHLSRILNREGRGAQESSRAPRGGSSRGWEVGACRKGKSNEKEKTLHHRVKPYHRKPFTASGVRFKKEFKTLTLLI